MTLQNCYPKYPQILIYRSNLLLRSIPDEDISEKARYKLHELLDKKYIHIMFQMAIDIGRTDLIDLDIPTDGPPIVLKLYTVPLKYCEFVDHESNSLKKWA